MITFRCPNCQVVIDVDDSHVGQEGQCGSCSASIVVPNFSTTQLQDPILVEKFAGPASQTATPVLGSRKSRRDPGTVKHKKQGCFFRCAGCNREHKARPEFSGIKVKCLNCGAVIQIPEMDGTAGRVYIAELVKPKKQNPETDTKEEIGLPKDPTLEDEIILGDIAPESDRAVSLAEQLALEALARPAPEPEEFSPTQADERMIELSNLVAQLETERQALLAANVQLAAKLQHSNNPGSSFDGNNNAYALASEKAGELEKLIEKLRVASLNVVQYTSNPSEYSIAAAPPLVKGDPRTKARSEPASMQVPIRPKSKAPALEQVPVETEDFVEVPDEPEPAGKKPLSRQQRMAVMALSILAIGISFYFIFRPTSKTPNRTTPPAVAVNPNPLPQGTGAPPSGPSDPPTGGKNAPTERELLSILPTEIKLGDKRTDAIVLTDAALRREYLADPVATNEKYQDRLVLMRGAYEAVKTSDLSKQKVPVLYYSGPGGKFTFTVPKQVFSNANKFPVPDNIFGVYQKDMVFRAYEHFTSPCIGEGLYAGKIIRITGMVQSCSPKAGAQAAISFVAPDTDNFLQIDYFFKDEERKKLAAVSPGQMITLEAKCNGRSMIDRNSGKQLPTVRLDNCKVDLKEPYDGLVAKYDDFVHQFEDDLRLEPRVNLSKGPLIFVTSKELMQRYDENVDTAENRYYRKILVLSGKVEKRQGRRLLFEFGTDDKVRIAANFTVPEFKKLGPSDDVKIRGVCAGMQKIGDLTTIWIENCREESDLVDEPADPSPEPPMPKHDDEKDPKTLVSHFPHNEGKSYKYYRKVISNNKLVSTGFYTLSHTKDKTIEYKEGKGKPVKLKYCLDRNGAIYIDSPEGSELVFKVGLKEGEQWKGPFMGEEAIYTVESIGKFGGKPEVVIKKKFPSGTIIHTFEENIGETRRVGKDANDVTVWEIDLARSSE